eukprot:gene5439-3922_t
MAVPSVTNDSHHNKQFREKSSRRRSVPDFSPSLIKLQLSLCTDDAVSGSSERAAAIFDMPVNFDTRAYLRCFLLPFLGVSFV